MVCNEAKILIQHDKKPMYCLKFIDQSISVYLHYLKMGASEKWGGMGMEVVSQGADFFVIMFYDS